LWGWQVCDTTRSFLPLRWSLTNLFTQSWIGTTMLTLVSHIVEVTDEQHHAQWPLEMGTLLTFCPGWPLIVILLISASQVAKITGMRYQCLATVVFLF
jgi:hypothetical protein